MQGGYVQWVGAGLATLAGSTKIHDDVVEGEHGQTLGPYMDFAC